MPLSPVRIVAARPRSTTTSPPEAGGTSIMAIA
jgi:hypothetical protein